MNTELNLIQENARLRTELETSIANYQKKLQELEETNQLLSKEIAELKKHLISVQEICFDSCL